MFEWLMSYVIGAALGGAPVYTALYYATSANYGVAIPTGVVAGVLVLLLTRITWFLAEAEKRALR